MSYSFENKALAVDETDGGDSKAGEDSADISAEFSRRYKRTFPDPNGNRIERTCVMYDVRLRVRV